MKYSVSVSANHNGIRKSDRNWQIVADSPNEAAKKAIDGGILSIYAFQNPKSFKNVQLRVKAIEPPAVFPIDFKEIEKISKYQEKPIKQTKYEHGLSEASWNKIFKNLVDTF